MLLEIEHWNEHNTWGGGRSSRPTFISWKKDGGPRNLFARSQANYSSIPHLIDGKFLNIWSLGNVTILHFEPFKLSVNLVYLDFHLDPWLHGLRFILFRFYRGNSDIFKFPNFQSTWIMSYPKSHIPRFKVIVGNPRLPFACNVVTPLLHHEAKSWVFGFFIFLSIYSLHGIEWRTINYWCDFWFATGQGLELYYCCDFEK